MLRANRKFGQQWADRQFHRGLSLRKLIEDSFNAAVKGMLPKGLVDQVRHPRDLFDNETIILEPESLAEINKARPLFDALEEALDDLWPLSHDTVTMPVAKAKETFPELHLLTETYSWTGLDEYVKVEMPLGGTVPESVREYVKLLALLQP